MKARQRNERSRQNEGRVVPTNKWSMQLDNLLLQSDGGKSRLHTCVGMSIMLTRPRVLLLLRRTFRTPHGAVVECSHK